MPPRAESSRRALTTARRTLLVAALAVAAAARAGEARAQTQGNGFLFATPPGSFTLRGGWAFASARSDLFAFTTENLTLDRGAFSSPALDADLAIRLADRWDLVLSSSYAGVTRRSEFRHFIDSNDRPIEQTTRFQRVPVTVGVRRYLASRGRSVGRFAWIPATFAPYVGAGAGVEWYQFRQAGDFIDFRSSNLAVFHSLMQTDSWGTTAHAAAGADYTLTPRFALSGEARYAWGQAGVHDDFKGFGRAELSGLTTTLGLTVRF